MKPTMQVENTATISFKVEERMQPVFDGKIVHRVCSTWDLAHQFELAARTVLVPHLEKDEEGIGSWVSIDHCSPAVLGSTVAVTATVIKTGETEVVCSIEARVGSRLIATGEQIQRVFPLKTIQRIITNANI
jgi:predicted thioesterase|tara:strand:- start:44 stop:439 length:396 start_codon:yes stop_codon:yes gene_type:complete